MKTFQQIARSLNAMSNCIKAGNTEWQGKHEQTILDLVKATAPSGSGIDCGTKIDLIKSSDEKLVFVVEYHHMNEGGYYDGWTTYTVTVKPSLAFGFAMTISGREKNGAKEYLHDVYHSWLDSDITEKQSALVGTVAI